MSDRKIAPARWVRLVCLGLRDHPGVAPWLVMTAAGMVAGLGRFEEMGLWGPAMGGGIMALLGGVPVLLSAYGRGRAEDQKRSGLMSDRKIELDPRPGVNYRTDVDGYPEEEAMPDGWVHCWDQGGDGWELLPAWRLCPGDIWRLQPPAPVSEPEPEEDDGWRAFEEDAPEVDSWVRVTRADGSTRADGKFQYLGRRWQDGEWRYCVAHPDDDHEWRCLGTDRWRPCAPPTPDREEPVERYAVEHLGRESRVIDTSEPHGPFVAAYHEGRWPNQWEKADRLADLLNAGERDAKSVRRLKVHIAGEKHEDLIASEERLVLVGKAEAGERAAQAAGVPLEELAKWVKTSRAERRTAHIRLHDAQSEVDLLERRLSAEQARVSEAWSDVHKTYGRVAELEAEVERLRASRLAAEQVISSLRERSLPEGVPWPDDMEWRKERMGLGGSRRCSYLTIGGNLIVCDTRDACLARLKEELGDE